MITIFPFTFPESNNRNSNMRCTLCSFCSLSSRQIYEIFLKFSNFIPFRYENKKKMGRSEVGGNKEVELKVFSCYGFKNITYKIALLS